MGLRRATNPDMGDAHMHRPRLAFGTLHPDSTAPFLLFPNTPDPGAAGGGTTPPAPPAAPTPPPAPPAPGAGEAADFPANTPVDQMTAPQQVAYWKHHSRKHETAAKALAEWQNQNKEKVDGYDKLVAASQTEQEKAIAEAKAAATAAGRAEMIPILLEAEFVAAAGLDKDGKPRLTREKARELVAPLSAAHFLGEDGKVDTAKVTGYVATYIGAAAPPAPPKGAPPVGFPSSGQGQQPAATATGKDAGLAEAKRRGFLKESASA